MTEPFNYANDDKADEINAISNGIVENLHLVDGWSKEAEQFSDMEAAIKIDPVLIRLNSAAEKELKRERQRWEKLMKLGKPKLWAPAPSRILTETAKDAAQSLEFARAYRYLMPNECTEHWNQGEYDEIVGGICKEICIGCAIDWSKLKERFAVGLENVLAAVENRALKAAVPAIVLFLVMFLTLPSRGDGSEVSWSCIGKDAMIATVKSVAVYCLPFFVGVPVLEVLDDFSKQRRDLLMAGYTEGDALKRASAGALMNSPIVQMLQKILGLFSGEEDQATIAQDELRPHEFCHEPFEDPLNSTILTDPVFLHGFPMDRSTADALFSNGHKLHPFTRNRMSRSHTVEPTSEFLDLRRRYIRRRHDIIQAVEAAKSRGTYALM